MSIYIQHNPINTMPRELGEEIEQHTCFLCGNHLFSDTERSTGGVVFWHGATGLLVLHQPCAEILGIQIIQDARSLVTETKRIAKLSAQPPQDANNLWYTKPN